MEWVNGLTYEAKIARKEQWHKWFAWYPVTIEIVGNIKTEQRHRKAWWQVVERKGKFHPGWHCDDWWTYEYRSIGD